MTNSSNIFLNKKILIYGLGKSGLSTFKFLKNKSKVFLYDDLQSNFKIPGIKKNLINLKKISKFKFDLIILSPGIDINKCKLSKFLKKNQKKIYTDLDVFNKFYNNDCITITGTNGKSTTCQLLHDVLSNQKIDVKLAGNIGVPILSVKNIKKKTLFIIEASSYQLDYSKIFKSRIAAILNLSPDHLERHVTIKNYIRAKFKLLKNQSKGHLAFIKKKDQLIEKEVKLKKFKGKIIKVDNQKAIKILKNLNNNYFSTETNKENLSFVLEITDKLFKLRKKILIDTIKKFKGLNYRQQIIFDKNNLKIINDSKSTSFSSSINILKSNKNIHWLLGGIPKKGDKFNLSKKNCYKIKAYIFGKNKKFFNQKLKGKIKYKNFRNLKEALKKVILLVKKEKFTNKTIIFSPCAASFDSFKNFEDRGSYFNKLIRKYFNEI